MQVQKHLTTGRMIP